MNGTAWIIPAADKPSAKKGREDAARRNRNADAFRFLPAVHARIEALAHAELENGGQCRHIDQGSQEIRA
jgi:hypothetical protein